MKKIIMIFLLIVFPAFSGSMEDEAREAYNAGDYKKAIDITKKACNDKIARACTGIGRAYEKGKMGLNIDYTEARHYYSQACTAGDGSACKYIGNLYKKGKGVKIDNKKAYTFYKKARSLFMHDCHDENNALSCFRLGDMLRDGEGGRKNYFKANQLYKKACDAKNPWGCSRLASSYYSGNGVRQDQNKAKELHGQACDLGLELGCIMYKTLNE
ncbi:tetratricopeptide repeat protein [Sulfurovum riftiae]|uniref:beta-lactamase n=1 Tax=Sulfurovum riftiae TaxID=1630136 RepID=A0A151CJ56_9BACT|nr:tetratricopeptide repeat protein [Sulfurovum riftiae]KYJ87529.1 hypothetical protein AS592_10505 [Sulfurovum riftiae]